MTARNHKLIYIAFAIVTLVVVLYLALIARRPVRSESELVAILIPARESRPMLYPDEGPFSSGDFMIVQQSVNRAVLTEPLSEHPADAVLIDHDCGILTVTIDANRNVALNTDPMGTMNDTNQLSTKLTEVFEQRVEQGAYLAGMETRTDLPDIQRIPRTVLIRAALSARYGDLVTLIGLLKELRADPIGLQINHLPA